MSTIPSASDESVERVAYTAPKLTVHGSMSDLTKGGGANTNAAADGDFTYAS